MAQKKSNAKLWLVLHSWCAVPIWFFLLFACLTGTLSTVSWEVLWLRYPEMRADADAGRERLDVGELLDRVVAYEPSARPYRILQPEPYLTVQVAAYLPYQEKATFFVDPYSGEVKGRSNLSYSRYQWFMQSLHGWLLTPYDRVKPYGWHFVALLSLPMLVSLVTGMLVYKKFWRAYLNPRLRFGQGSRIFWGDLHRLAGLWSLWFVSLIAISSLWFLVIGILDELGSQITGDLPPLVQEARQETRGLRHAFTIAGETFPSFRLDGVYFGFNNYTPVRVTGRTAFPLYKSQIYLNPGSGSVIETRTVTTSRTASTISPILRSLHTGDFYSLWSKLIWAFFGLVLTAMVFSGLMIFLRRTIQSTKGLVAERSGLLPREAGE